MMRIFAYILLAIWIIAVVGSVVFGSEPPMPTGYLTTNATVNAPVVVEGVYTNALQVIVIPAPPPGEPEWELSFEWADNAEGTNAKPYPIFIQTPFEYDGGFIFIRARKTLERE